MSKHKTMARVTSHARERAEERAGCESIAFECAKRIEGGDSKRIADPQDGVTEYHHVRIDGVLLKVVWSPADRLVVTIMNAKKPKRLVETKLHAYRGGQFKGKYKPPRRDKRSRHAPSAS